MRRKNETERVREVTIGDALAHALAGGPAADTERVREVSNSTAPGTHYQRALPAVKKELRNNPLSS